jgi:hypothetical protein
MDKIGFLFWTDGAAEEESAEETAERIAYTEFAKKACALVEDEINEAGGIAGKEIFIQLEIVSPDRRTGQDQFSEKITNSPDLLFGAFPPHAGREDLERLKKHGSDAYVLFSVHDLGWNLTEPIHPNIFNVASAGRRNNHMMPKLLEPLDAGSIIFFHLEITDPETYRVLLPPEFQSKFTPIGFDFDEADDPAKLDEKINSVLANLAEDAVLFVNTTEPFSVKIFQYLNENRLRPPVVSFYLGEALNQMTAIEFPLVEVTVVGNSTHLGMESVFDKITPNATSHQKASYQQWFFQLELVSLVHQAARRANLEFSSTKTFVRDIVQAINRIDGVNDIFIGKSDIFAFQKNSNTIAQHFLHQFPKSLQGGGQITPLLYPKQLVQVDDTFQFIDVNYVYVDILRVNHINIGDATWSCEFNLDIVSRHSDPIDIVKFNNLSAVHPQYESKLVSETEIGKDGERTHRYFVVATFDFDAIADGYPFDRQHIFLSYSITDESKFGVLSPTPEMLLDREFAIEGWKLEDANTGVIRRKSTLNQGFDLHKSVKVSQEVRLGWTLARSNSITMLKILIPLLFLIFLNYYTLFIPFKEINTSIGILTTAFLAGIALYFSTERPQPLRMTTIDLIFAGFYCIIGITIVLTALGLIGKDFHSWMMFGLRVAVPLSVVGFAAYLVRRVKSPALRPKID